MLSVASSACKIAVLIASVVCTDRLCKICGKYMAYCNTTNTAHLLMMFSLYPVSFQSFVCLDLSPTDETQNS